MTPRLPSALLIRTTDEIDWKMSELYRMPSDQAPYRTTPKYPCTLVASGYSTHCPQMPFHCFCGSHTAPIPQSIWFCFHWPAPEISLTIQGLLEPLIPHTQNVSCVLPLIQGSPWSMADCKGDMEAQLLAIKPGYTQRYKLHSRFH